MAQKPRKQARKAPAQPAKGGPETAPQRDPLAELEAECARLKAELAATKGRLEALEEQRKELLDRIDWAIDSLHSLMEK